VILAEGVVRVHEALRILGRRSLDVPENVVRNSIEDLVGSGTLKTSLEGILEILDKVVLLTILENGEFLIEDIIKLVNIEL